MCFMDNHLLFLNYNLNLILNQDRPEIKLFACDNLNYKYFYLITC